MIHYFAVQCAFASLTASLIGVVLLLSLLWKKVAIRQASFPPRVSTRMPWIGPTIEFCKGPTRFMQWCHSEYGSTYQLYVGLRRMVVVTSPEGLAHVLSDRAKTLDTHSNHIALLAQFSFRSNVIEMNHFQLHQLFPVVADGLSVRRCSTYSANLTADIAGRLLAYVGDGYSVVRLQEITQHPVFESINAVVFGPLFPVESYFDWQAVDKGLPDMVFGLPFFSAPSARRGRKRLIATTKTYLQAARRDLAGLYYLKGASEMVNEAYTACLDAGLHEDDTASMFCLFMWGLHTTIVGTVFWLMAHIIHDPMNIQRLQNEFAKGLPSRYPDLKSWLESDPDVINNECFNTLDSAIQETLRLCTRSNPFRDVEADTVLSLGGRPIHLNQGDFFVGDICQLNVDETRYPDPHQFVMDRFLTTAGKSRQSPVPPTFGRGKHMCKGRHFTRLVLKTYMIITIELFNLAPVLPDGVESYITKPKGRNMAVVLPNDSLLVGIQRRSGK